MSISYVKVSCRIGIRQHKQSGRFQATKKIAGRQYAATFSVLGEAERWRINFVGRPRLGLRSGRTSTLEMVWLRMQELHFPSLELSTRKTWLQRWQNLSDLSQLQMRDITPARVNRWVVEKKEWFSSAEYARRGRGKASRCNLDNELNLLSTIFNWYREEEEFEWESIGMASPVRRRHRRIGVLRPISNELPHKQIAIDAAFRFFAKLPDLYRDLAMAQFLCAGRIGEIAGIQISNIRLEEEVLTVRDSISWCNQSKTFEYLKPYPKNREGRQVHIHTRLREILDRRLASKKDGCNFLFHVNGEPLNYCTIQSQYRRAQIAAKIPFRGTHCLRHGMAALARRVGGNGLDSVIAMTGHKDIALADYYSKSHGVLQKETSLHIMHHIEEQLSCLNCGW
jgi:integrase